MINKTAKVGNLEIDLEELAEFLVKAKTGCYASGGNEQRMPDGAKRLVFQEGNFHYTDQYWGFFQAPGMEVVRFKNENGPALWTMAYSGGMLPKYHGNIELAKRTFNVLKEALGFVVAGKPFRGPHEFRTDAWTYTSAEIGNITRFTGIETISFEHEPVFVQDFSGGLVIPK